MYFVDKRIVQTRKLMAEALIALLKDKPINKVTITELCKKSGVARVTFYRNHSTLEELLTERLKDWYYLTFYDIQNIDEDLNLMFFKACQKDFDFFRIIYKYNLDGPVIAELQKCIDSVIRKIDKNLLIEKNFPFHINYPYSVYAFTGISHMTIRYWIENDSLTAEEITEMFNTYHNGENNLIKEI